jgi:histone-lysine N-methyltransferase SETD3
MPVCFDDTEMAFLQGSLAVAEITRLRQGAQWEYHQLCLALPEFAEFKAEDYFWARLVVVTRIFGITVHGDSTTALVPMADMLNHKRPAETHWGFDPTDDSFVITSLKPLQAGEQV